jgi:hypothetical protein
MARLAKAFLFAVLFTVIGLILFALLAPLLFPNADLRKLGQLAGPIIVLVGGGIGFVFGWARAKKK